MEYQRLLRTEKVASIAENFSEYGILQTAYIKYFVLQKDMLQSNQIKFFSPSNFSAISRCLCSYQK